MSALKSVRFVVNEKTTKNDSQIIPFLKKVSALERFHYNLLQTFRKISFPLTDIPIGNVEDRFLLEREVFRNFPFSRLSINEKVKQNLDYNLTIKT